MKFIELKKHLKSGEFSPIYVLHGDDDWVMSTCYKMFLNSILDVPELNLATFENCNDAAKIFEACESIPFMSDWRVVAASGYNMTNKTQIDTLTKYTSSFCPSTILVIKTMGAVVMDLPNTIYVDCNQLPLPTILLWLKREIVGYNSTINDDAAILLTELTLCNMSRISTEILKLASYRYNSTITADDVKQMVSADTQYKVFALTDAIAHKQNQLAYVILTQLWNEKNQPIMLMGLLYNHFRRLLYCSLAAGDEQLPRYLGVKEYAIKMSLKQVKYFSKLRLYNICKIFHASDWNFKSGGVGGKLAVELIIANLLTV